MWRQSDNLTVALTVLAYFLHDSETAGLSFFFFFYELTHPLRDVMMIY